MPRSGLQMRCQIAAKQESPQIPARPKKKQPRENNSCFCALGCKSRKPLCVSKVRPAAWVFTLDAQDPSELWYPVALSKGANPCLAQAARAAAVPRELQRLPVCNQGVCRKKQVLFLLLDVNAVSCHLGFLFFFFFYYLEDRTNTRK